MCKMATEIKLDVINKSPVFSVKYIHYFSGQSQAPVPADQCDLWRIFVWTEDEIKREILSYDTQHSTNFATKDLSNDTYLEYFILYLYGGIFVHKNSNISFKNIVRLHSYCDSRSVTLFETIDVTYNGKYKHIELLQLLSHDGFIPLLCTDERSMYNNTSPGCDEDSSRKTVTSSLSVAEYLDTLPKDPIPPEVKSDLATPVAFGALGLLGGYLIGFFIHSRK
jgi:hypothetical protein